MDVCSESSPLRHNRSCVTLIRDKAGKKTLSGLFRSNCPRPDAQTHALRHGRALGPCAWPNWRAVARPDAAGEPRSALACPCLVRPSCTLSVGHQEQVYVAGVRATRRRFQATSPAPFCGVSRSPAPCLHPSSSNRCQGDRGGLRHPANSAHRTVSRPRPERAQQAQPDRMADGATIPTRRNGAAPEVRHDLPRRGAVGISATPMSHGRCREKGARGRQRATVTPVPSNICSTVLGLCRAGL